MTEFESGRKTGIQECMDLIKQWQLAYPTDIFIPPTKKPPIKSISQSRYDRIKTQCSAAMGRHMSTVIMNQFIDLFAKDYEGCG